MTEPGATVDTAKAARLHRMTRAVTGLVLILGGVPVYMLLLDQPMLRRTALPFWVMAAIGLALAVSSTLVDKRWRVRVVNGISFLFIALFMYGFFVMGSVPQSPEFARLDAAPSFALADHHGATVRLDELRQTGPALLVFYRGHW